MASCRKFWKVLQWPWTIWAEWCISIVAVKVPSRVETSCGNSLRGRDMNGLKDCLPGWSQRVFWGVHPPTTKGVMFRICSLIWPAAHYCWPGACESTPRFPKLLSQEQGRTAWDDARSVSSRGTRRDMHWFSEPLSRHSDPLDSASKTWRKHSYVFLTDGQDMSRYPINER